MRFTQAILFLLLMRPAIAHELAENRATIVLRDKTHVSVTLYVNYAEALHSLLSPQNAPGAFLVAYSSMKPEDLSKELLRAQKQFETATQLYLAHSRKEVKLTNWVWPDAKQVQAMLQRQIMQAMVDPASHAHEPPAEIHVEGNASSEIFSLTMQFPQHFQRVLVVSYRPNQVWSERGALSPEIKF